MLLKPRHDQQIVWGLTVEVLAEDELPCLFHPGQQAAGPGLTNFLSREKGSRVDAVS